MTDSRPTREQVEDAERRVAERGRQRSKAARHPFAPVTQLGSDGKPFPCEHCHSRQNPARWPVFFREDPLAGQLLWTCSTCKIAQTDARSTANVLVGPPAMM